MVAHKKKKNPQKHDTEQYQGIRNQFIDAFTAGSVERFTELSGKLSDKDLLHAMDNLRHGLPEKVGRTTRDTMFQTLLGQLQEGLSQLSTAKEQTSSMAKYIEIAQSNRFNAVISDVLMPTCRLYLEQTKGMKYTEAEQKQQLLLVAKELGHKRRGSFYAKCSAACDNALNALEDDGPIYQTIDSKSKEVTIDTDFASKVVAATKSLDYASKLSEEELAKEALSIVTDKLVGLHLTGKKIPTKGEIRGKYEAQYEAKYNRQNPLVNPTYQETVQHGGTQGRAGDLGPDYIELQ